ncbi:lyase family protein, partial [Halomonas sp. 707B3]
MDTRIERDSMGELEVPAKALYGAQTQRAINNFPVSGTPMPVAFVHAVARIKLAAARSNHQLGLLDAERAQAIEKAAQAVIDGQHDDHFPIDVFQTGSGTSTNMNVNEVLATLASREGVEVAPNDHVNMGQSSNDVIPTAIHLSAAIAVNESLRPALVALQATIDRRADELSHVVKTGRTHLMDAMPLRMDQELGAWSSQVGQAIERFDSAMVRLCRLAQGGTAVGTGINAPEGFADLMAKELSQQTGLSFVPNDSFFASLASQDAAVELSGQLKGFACVVMKIANDLRWMNSGPLAGLGEIELEALQPGSSIMPGKVNPVIPESAAQAAAQVMGLDTAITVAGQSG